MASSEPSDDVRPSVEELSNFIRKDVLGRPKVMGIVNVTNDSFYKDSRYNQEQAIKAALEMWDLGVDWIDIGGESTRPGSKEISSEKELKRVIPIIKEIKSLIPNVLISIDTKKPDVAKEAINAGALMINDVSGLRNDEMFELILSERIPVCIMHMQNNPEDMQVSPDYGDCLGDVSNYLFSKADELIKRGFPQELIILDPGIGFGKLLEHNLELLRGTEKLRRGIFSVLNGVSRKSMIGEIINSKSASDRLAGTLGASAYAQMNGIDILRVHDVKEHIDLSNVLSSLING